MELYYLQLRHDWRLATTSKGRFMTLDDWIRLPAEERQKLLIEWCDDRNKWWSIAHDAVEVFQCEFGGHSEILCVSPAQTRSHNAEPQVYIDVRTRLPHSQRLPDLPSEYLTFPVKQDGLAEPIDAFKNNWSAILKRIFDWDDTCIQQFISNQEHVFHSGWFLHDSPLDTRPPSVLSDSLVGKRVLSEANRIGDKIVEAIRADTRHSDHFYLADDPEFDWAAARRRVEGVAAKYR
jgi:hypothetical protein